MADPAHVKRFERALQALRDVGDPLDRLDAVRSSREQLEALEAATVVAARTSGATWKDIGALYGLSKQGAQQRFRPAAPALKRSPKPNPKPAPPPATKPAPKPAGKPTLPSNLATPD
ncbi:hypothetical protein [Nakamurella lactea]|uniref:hypothetical protein n=1 Tax=Nakamurella lactea TaxID=459515 RepID=UPI0004112C77|nr:hypothetical protein [Nakamurella lactea]